MSVDLCVQGATYHTYVRFCCQSQVQITYIACVRCILGAMQSHMIISQKGMRKSIPHDGRCWWAQICVHLHVSYMLYHHAGDAD